MTRQGIDYSIPRPNPNTVRQLGFEFVCRYLAYKPNPKVLSREELSALHDAGLDVLLNWENQNNSMIHGYSMGVQHAKEALAQAKSLGAPDGVPIFFSCDYDAVDMGSVRQYMLGAATVIPRGGLGIYGGYRVIEAIVPTYAAYGWQTYAWSGGRISGQAHLYQYKNGVTVAGADVDRNRTLNDDAPIFWKADTMELSDTVWTAAADNPAKVPAGPRTVMNVLASVDQRTSALTNAGMVDDVEDAVKAVKASVDALKAALPTSGLGLSDADVERIAQRVADVIEGRMQS